MKNSLRSSPKAKRDVLTTKSGRVVKANSKYAYSTITKCQPSSETIIVTNKPKNKLNQSPQTSTLKSTANSTTTKKKPTNSKTKDNLPKTRKSARTKEVYEEKSLLSSPKDKIVRVATRSGRVCKTNLTSDSNKVTKTTVKKSVTEYQNIKDTETNKEVVSPIISEKKPVYAEASEHLFEDKNMMRTGDIYDMVFDPDEEEPPPQNKKKKRRVIRKKPNTPKPFFVSNNYEKNIFKALSSLKKIVSKKKSLSPIMETVNVPEKQQNVNMKPNIPVNTETELNSNHQAKDIISNNPETATTLCNQSKPSIVINNVSGYKDISNNNPKTVTIYNQTNTNIVTNNVSGYKDISNNNPKTVTMCNQTNTNIVTNNVSGYKDISNNNPKTVTICNQTNTNIVTNNLSEDKETSSNSTKTLGEYNSVCVEDIVADFEPFTECNDDNLDEVDYSPVHSPLQPSTPHNGQNVSINNHRDPLNLLDEGSFFNEPPVANSSMISNRNPEASPWRAEFKKLPIKWPVNTYVKPNMTPALESSYIDLDESKKRHVYTSMVPINNEKSPAKSSSDKENNTYFGFDDTEENRENISPVKSKPKKKVTRSQARLVLRDLNTKDGPTRAVMVSKPKFTPSSELVDKLFEEINFGAVAPDFSPEGEDKQTENTNVTNLPMQEEDSQSIHLFEDLQVTHHLKPSRKSYGKAKRLAFRDEASSNSDDEDFQPEHADESFEDDFGQLAADLSYVPPSNRPKRKTKKRTKKEDPAAEAWAAEFNSMCKDVDEFPLNVE